MFSVIIPLYNKEKDIFNTVSSVLFQTFNQFELIIVNDGSTDNSTQIIKQFDDPRIRLINQENQGVSVARNNGISFSRNNYIALLDGDDLWSPTFLEEMYALIQDYPVASLFGATYSFQDLNNKILTCDLGLPESFRGVVDYFVYAKNNTLFTSSSVVFRKDDFIELGEFDTILTRGEDIDLWIRFGLNKKVAFYNKSLVIYKIGSENRALNKRVTYEKTLLGNLKRYKQYEISNPKFKEFLDNWRLAHVHNYLTGASTEVTEIESLLKEVDLKDRSKIWTLLLLSPKVLQTYIYRGWISCRSKRHKVI